MPYLTGIELMERIQTMEHRRGTPVVMLTAKGLDADRRAAVALGAREFMTKPFSPKKLLARIHELLDE
jgi:DNA-binding response OmpR family regulator